MKKRLWFVASLCLVSILTVQCGGTPTPAPSAPVSAPTAQSAPVEGGTLIVAIPSDASSFDPNQLRESGTWRVMAQVFDTIVEEDDAGGKVNPALAEKWDVSADGLVYTFFLRKGVKFHDGTPFNAEAVKYTIDRQIVPEHPHYKDGDWNLARLLLWPIKNVEVVDEYTVKINLKEPVAPFLTWMGTYASFIVSPASVEKYGKDVINHPAGTGPFKLVSWERGQRIVLEKNPDYWGGAPKIDKLILLPILEGQGRLQALEAGTVQMMLDVPVDNADKLKSDPRFQVFQAKTRQIWHLGLNEKRVPAFKDKRVRQAVNYAINKDVIVKDVLKGFGEVAISPFSTSFGPWYTADVTKYNYDPEKAKKLLAEAGYANGFEVTCNTPETGFAVQQPVAMLQVIQSNLAAVGITMKIQTLEFATYMSRYQFGDYEMTMRAYYSNQSDPDNYLTNLHHSRQQPKPEGNGGLDTGYYVNPEVDKLIDAQRKELDVQKRIALVHQAIKLIVDDAPWAYVDHMLDVHVATKNVKGVVMHPQAVVDFRKAYIEK